tara:strand:+ start:685 stop:888 length:204 start_codon:yes stop_codon:yes gene_type:complete
MTRKHYIKIAKVLNLYRDMIGRLSQDDFPSVESRIFDKMVDEFAILFASENRRFDSQKFIDAVNKSN